MSKSKTLGRVYPSCPECKQIEHVGFLGGGQCKRYFCSDCCVEFVIREQKMEIYYFDKDGVMEKE